MADFYSKHTSEDIEHILDNSASLQFVRGESEEINTKDPIKYKYFEGDDVFGQLNEYLDSIHGTTSIGIPHGYIRCSLWGAFINVFNTVHSYGDDIWAQVALNANVVNGRLELGDGVCRRHHSNGVWSPWVLFGDCKVIDINPLLDNGSVWGYTISELSKSKLFVTTPQGDIDAKVVATARDIRLNYELMEVGEEGATVYLHSYPLTESDNTIYIGSEEVYSLNYK